MLGIGNFCDKDCRVVFTKRSVVSGGGGGGNGSGSGGGGRGDAKHCPN